MVRPFRSCTAYRHQGSTAVTRPASLGRSDLPTPPRYDRGQTDRQLWRVGHWTAVTVACTSASARYRHIWRLMSRVVTARSRVGALRIAWSGLLHSGQEAQGDGTEAFEGYFS